MLIWPWIIRAFALAAAVFLFMEWQNLGVQWAALFNWVLVMGGAEAIIHVSRQARVGAAAPAAQGRAGGAATVPRLRGGRRRTDPPPA